MRIEVFESGEKMAQALAGAIAEFVSTHPGTLLCLAAGDTPLAAYGELARMHKAGAVDLNTVDYVGLDEWVGLGRKDKGSCRQVMFEDFYDAAGIDHGRILAFDGLDGDLEGQCRAVDARIAAHGGIGLTVLGIGMNGHVGFNEPGADPHSAAHTVALDEITQRVGAKYFANGQVPRRGVTVGLGQLRGARHILLVANGEHKAPIVARALRGQESPEVPASLLRGGNLTVWLDEAAAAKL